MAPDEDLSFDIRACMGQTCLRLAWSCWHVVHVFWIGIRYIITSLDSQFRIDLL